MGLRANLCHVAYEVRDGWQRPAPDMHVRVHRQVLVPHFDLGEIDVHPATRKTKKKTKLVSHKQSTSVKNIFTLSKTKADATLGAAAADATSDTHDHPAQKKRYT